MEPVHQRFRAMLSHLSAWANQPLTASLVDGAPSDYPNRRDYARCVFDPRGLLKGRCEIQVAPRFWKTSRRRREALLRHELGHVANFLMGSARVDELLGSPSKNPELRADRVAKAVWGDDLVYDRGSDVQTLPSSWGSSRGSSRGAARGRPSYLPTGLEPAHPNGLRRRTTADGSDSISNATKINGQRVVINFWRDPSDPTVD
jgi:hypothetical protein